MVASSLAEIAETGTAGYAAGAVLLALLSGAILLGMGAARLGFLVNFLSHPVISGFSSAAALIIGLAQLKHLIGIDIARSQHITDILAAAYGKLDQVNLTTLALSVGTLAILLIWKGPLSRWLQQLGIGKATADQIAKSGPLIAVVTTTWLIWHFALDATAGVKIVADVPVGLPPLTVPSFDLDLIRALLVPALTGQ